MFRKKARGLFDLLMALLAVSTLCTATPLGELFMRLGRWAAGRPGRETDLVSFFDAGQLSPSLLGPAKRLLSVSLAHGAAPTLLRAVAVSLSEAHGVEPTMDLPPEGRRLLLERGADANELEAPEGRIRAVDAALPGLERELGSMDAALAALVLGMDQVRYAVDRVRAERAAPSLEALLPHLPPTSRRRAKASVGRALTLATAFDLAWPVPEGTRISSPFGRRIHPLTGLSQLHTGVDLSVPVGTPVLATAAGIVRRIGEDGINGRYLIVDHGRGVTTAYCHADAVLVERGARIERSQPIARSGSTGRSTGPHLHYQVDLAGAPVDPLALRGAIPVQTR
jgi:murein DD-endopeptidase MepM/ murein hydrolase activator NlpD